MNNTTFSSNTELGWVGVNAVLHCFALLTNLTFVMVAVIDRTGLAGPRLLILNLAVCGLILSAGWYPATTFMAQRWQPDPPPSCSFFAGTIFFVTATNWSDVPLAINRIVAICFPLYYRSFNTRLVSCVMIILSWVVPLALVLLTFFRIGAAFVGAPYGTCVIRALRPFGKIYSFVPAVIPFALVGLACCELFTAAHLKTRVSNKLSTRSKRLLKRRLNIATAMLATLMWHVLMSFPIIYVSYGLPQVISQKPWLGNVIRGCTTLEFAISPKSETWPSCNRGENLRLINDMTLAEKLGQLQQLSGTWYGEVADYDIPPIKQGLAGSILNVHGAARTNQIQRWALESRLKIPVLIAVDVIHGFRTLFPIPLDETASWDLEAVEQAAAIAAAEARSVGIHWTFAPMFDVMRDPRWSRIVEGSGEDVHLGNLMAKARIRGFQVSCQDSRGQGEYTLMSRFGVFQGTDYSAPDRVLACAKHFAAYGAAEAGRDYNGADMSERRLREIYLPPFKAAVDAGVGSFMTAFNDLSGVPATDNKFLLTKVLRDEWKFDGLVVYDWDAVYELINHQYATNKSEAAMHAVNAGTDMEMNSRTYVTHGAQLIQSGKVSTGTVNTAVRNIVRIKFRLELFDNSFTDETLESQTLFKEKFVAAARNITARTMVLLKNENNLLPVSTTIGKLAVIGGLAADKYETTDHWPGDVHWQNFVTMLDGIMTKLGVTSTNGQVTYAEGCDAYCSNTLTFDNAVRVARAADFVVVAVGEPREYSGEAG
ncbi:hypothetical protein RvY_12082 [Ramazzottius varieornatus]|uniref:beta-glucosidase n=1 Tax=Ramazzottius varieornatus TaxID=947166 RepID=A0A1D1VNP3_RAMVA|nr:hypothetical protein RvY_12082 [Ramazzottius varieornatus]